MDSLADEVLIKIFSYLDVLDLKNVGLINSKYHNLSHDDLLWKPHVINNFGEVDLIGNCYYRTFFHYNKYKKVYVVFTDSEEFGSYVIGVYKTYEIAFEAMKLDLYNDPEKLNGSSFFNNLCKKYPTINHDLICEFFTDSLGAHQHCYIFQDPQYNLLLGLYKRELDIFIDKFRKSEVKVKSFLINRTYTCFYHIKNVDIQWTMANY